MAVVRVVFSPDAIVARARSLRSVGSSESSISRQPWFEGAVVLFGQLANVLVGLLTPAAMLALVMGLWRVAADLGWASAFLFTAGFFSHWQVWIALSIGLKMLSFTLFAWGSRTAKFSEEN
jgi:hypothetical protein